MDLCISFHTPGPDETEITGSVEGTDGEEEEDFLRRPAWQPLWDRMSSAELKTASYVMASKIPHVKESRKRARVASDANGDDVNDGYDENDEDERVEEEEERGFDSEVK